MEELLRKNKLKITRQRLEILNLINTLDDNATIKNISSKMKIDNSTMYRIIELLLEKNIIEKNLNYDNEIYFKIKENHIHYIKCIKCHKKEKIEICPIENIEEKGFKILNHKIEIDGICTDCFES